MMPENERFTDSDGIASTEGDLTTEELRAIISKRITDSEESVKIKPVRPTEIEK